MKRLLAALLLLVLLTGTSYAATSTGTFTFSQVLPSPVTVFGGWEIHVADAQTGTYTLFATVPYVSTQSIYTVTQPLTVPDGVHTTKWFKLLAYNKSGKKSAFTAPISASVDLESAPAIPVVVTITITTP
jgi:hypothetical protein